MRDVSANGVLVVDDDPAVREMVTVRLAKERFEVQQAEDGIAALVKLRDMIPKVIISDLQMPRMAGIEFIGVVRRRFPAIPVIVLTGSFPREFPPEAKPDRWFDKNTRNITELVRAVHDLAQNTPDSVDLPQVISIPVPTRPSGAGYFILTCTDCLRPFEWSSEPEDKTVDRIAICIYCEACVPYLIESSEPA